MTTQTVFKKIGQVGFILIAILIASCGSTKPVLTDEATKEKMILGKCTWSDWKKNADWSSYHDSTYNADSLSMVKLKTLASSSDLSFKLFVGSWCGDSKSQVPKWNHVFARTNIDWQRVSLFGVNRSKREVSGKAERNKIVRVPTLVVFRANTEIGRVIEYPKESIEKDLVGILDKK
jgi:hypothetical protein